MNESTSLGVSAGSLSDHGQLRAAPPADPAYSFEASRERMLLTLLALDLMLMAFFVVLNSSATFDRARSAAVAQSMTASDHAPPAGPLVAAGANRDDASTQRGLAAVSLRAAVADVFEPFVSSDRGITTAANDDRVDVDLPADIMIAGDQLPPALLDGLAHVMANPPPGYRTELVIRAKAANPSITTQLARLADAIVARGVTSTALSVGLLAATVHKDEPAALRFSFLLLEPGEESSIAHLDTAGEHP